MAGFITVDSIDYRAIKRLMARSTELEAHLVARLEAAKSFAVSISPDAPPIGAGYVSSFAVESAQFPDGVPLARLVNTDAKWAVVEYGSGTAGPVGPRRQGGYSPAQHVFSQTLAWLQGTA